jgi:two-component system cell cycle sensor histidine kinase/response regulator CckA
VQRILIVDDIAENLLFLEALLKGNGFEVHSARNGAEALESARASPPDLVVSDILMPRMDGFSLCREWKADPRLAAIPFVFYTATYTGAKDEALGLKLGAARYVMKPQEPEDLRAVLREVLAESRAGSPRASAPPSAGEDELAREHHEAVGRKLEKKLAELERANEELRASRQLIDAIVENVPLMVFLKEATELRFVVFNRAGEELVGRPRAEVLGKTDLDLFPPEQAASFMARDREVLAGGGPVDIPEEPIRTANQGERVLHTRKVRIDGPDGATKYLLGISEDITERKRAEADRDRLEEQLRAAQKLEAIGSLAGGIAHDFNNLLSVILSHTELAMGALRKGDPVRDDLALVKEGAESAASLTRQLLAFGRKQVMQAVPVSVNEIADGMEGMLRRLVGENIEVRKALAPDAGVVRVDPGQMQQVLMNLVVNARDAMPRGGKLTIETANVEIDPEYASRHVAVKPGPYVVLAVTDTGSGMDARTRDRIFEPFFTTKEKGKGTGLGLSTVYGIVRQSGGNIWVYSEPGRGTTFKVYLPRDTSTAKPVATAPRPAPRRTDGNETILVVEDEEALIKVATRTLAAAGYTVLTARDGEEALRTASQYRGDIHLLATDVIMPRMGGTALASALARARPGLKVLYMSGYTDDAILHQGVLGPGTKLLAKPFTTAELALKVREVLDEDAGRR